MQKFNIRGSDGKFSKGGCGCRGVCATNKRKVVSGRLYMWRGSTVRALGAKFIDKGVEQRLVSVHKTLTGFVPENELRPIGREQVDVYLGRGATIQ